MSNIYIQEPPTNGKVLLKTTVGDIDVELWTKECPKACRNFIQLCMEGYYDGLIFHRLVPKFIVQTGDPTGTGCGGESIYGENFKDEFHSRLKFNRRGLVAMANAAKNDNGSQFFFTLDATPELQDKHTLFGKVTGNTIYNMIKLGDMTVDRNERPHHPHKILSTEILSNPFDDILPRETSGRKTKSETRKSEPVIEGKKDFKLLSFGDEAEEEEEEILKVVSDSRGSSKSSHDLCNDPLLSSIPVIDPVSMQPPPDRRSQTDLLEEKFKEKKKKRKHKSHNEGDGGDAPAAKPDQESAAATESAERKDKTLSKVEAAREEYNRLKREMAREKRKKQDKDVGAEEVATKDDAVSEFLREKEKYRTQSKQILKSKDSRREEQTLELLSKFRSKLKDQQSKDKDDDHQIGTEWMGHRFTCSKEDERPVLAKDANMRGEGDWYDLYDPRNKITQRRAGDSVASSHKK